MLDVILSAELLFEAIETAVGNSDTTSFAKLGPDKLTYLLGGSFNTSANISFTNFEDLISIPLDALIIIALGFKKFLILINRGLRY